MSQKSKWIYKINFRVTPKTPSWNTEYYGKTFLDLKRRIGGRWPDKKTAVRLYTTSFFL